MKAETTKKILEEYFLLKIVLGIAGVFLFLINYFSIISLSFGGFGSYIIWLFGDATLFRISLIIPIVFVLLSFFTYYSLKKEMGVAKIIGSALLMIDLFSFPVGTILSIIMFAFLLMPQFNLQLQPIARNTRAYRYIGCAIILLAVLGFFYTNGTINNFARNVTGLGAVASVMDASLLNETGPIDVIIQLQSQPTTMATVQAQDVFVQDVEALGGTVTDRLIYSDNAIRTTIDTSSLVSLASNPNVKRIVKNEIVWFTPQGTGNNSYTVSQLADNRYDLMKVLPLWGQGLTGNDIVVAVVDTGINSKLPCFQRDGKSIVIDSLQLYGEYVMWHGSAVASCIASQDSSIKGIAPGVELLNVEVFMPSGGADLFSIKKGWDWVAKWSVNHPDKFIICCNSIGASPIGLTGGWIAPGILDEQANNMVLNYNIPMIVAAGNGQPSNPLSMKINCPGQAQYVLTVGAVDSSNLQIAWFSCRGGTVDGKPKPDVVAPGVSILMPSDVKNMIPSNQYPCMGTSFSTPLVAGVAALIAEQHKTYSATQIQEAMKTGADTSVLPHGSNYNTNYGHGLVNAENALAVINGQKPEQMNSYSFGVFIIIGVIVFFVPEIRRRK